MHCFLKTNQNRSSTGTFESRSSRQASMRSKGRRLEVRDWLQQVLPSKLDACADVTTCCCDIHKSDKCQHRQFKTAFDSAVMDFPALTSLIFLGLTHFLGKYISKKIIVSNSPSSSFIKRLEETKLKLSYQSFTNSLTANSTSWACFLIPLTKEEAISRIGTSRRTIEFI